MPRRALLLDRDGTLIVDVGYPRDPDAVVLLPGAAAALAALPADVALVIVTNQSGLARGRITLAEADAVQARVEALFSAAGVRFAGVFRCPHGPDDDCPCRKPRPGLVLEAIAALDLDPTQAVIVGDKPSDLAAGAAVGIPGVQLITPDDVDVAAVGDPTCARGWPAAAQRIATLLQIE